MIPPSVHTVENDAGYRLEFAMYDDGPEPQRYFIHELGIPRERVPEKERDDLYDRAWRAWHQRGHGDYEDNIDFDSGLEDRDEH